MKKRICLAACLLALALASGSCGSETDKPSPASGSSEEGTASVTDSGEETGDPEETWYSLPEPDLPEMDFGGAPFIIYLGESEDINDIAGNYFHSSQLFPPQSFIWVEKLNGEVVNDAVFNRNLVIENKFNIKITPLLTDMNAYELVQAGETMDLVQAKGPYLAETVSTGAWLNLIGFPYLNLTAEYWNARALEGTIVDDIAFFLPSDFCLEPLANTGILYFNKRILQENDLENPYDLVHSDTWTIDRFLSLVRSVPKDLNGDGQMDFSDLYGALVRYQWRTGMFFQLYFGIGLTDTRVDKDQGRVLNFDPTRCQDLIDTVWEVFQDKKICMNSSAVEEELGEGAYEIMFLEGGALFCQDYVFSLDTFREMEDDFGIVPFPKYDTEQEEYYQRVHPASTMFAFPASVQDEEKAGLITEYCSWISHNTVLPAYYEITVKAKRVRDLEAVEMLDIIRKSQVYEFAEMFYTHIPHYMWDAFTDRSFARRVQTNTKFLSKRLAKYIKDIRNAAD
ncbi:MAG: hypothetical protein II719_03725 [Clostridia bacterium]|nr:hypothetical protein [Clostridia bacterium]